MASWEPAVISDVLFETGRGEVSHWFEIAGTCIEWDEPNEDPQALIEVTETTAIYQCKWQFHAVPGNRRVRLVLNGITDIDAVYTRIPIQLDAELGIAPWPMRFKPEEECLARCRFLGFKDNVRYAQDDGVSTLVFVDQ